jgi:hypothetical protein
MNDEWRDLASDSFVIYWRPGGGKGFRTWSV